jgi:methyltransferase (TIGR00027 family)
MRVTRLFSGPYKGFSISTALLILMAAPALCVEPGKPSKTSLLVSMWRAIGAGDPDAETRNPDYLARRFLGAQEGALMSEASTLACLDMKFEEAMRCIQDAGVSASFFNILSRTKHIDATMRRALESGTTQVVILGAGFDSRAYRFGDLLRGVKVYEVDFPPTLEYKKRRVREVLGRMPANVIYVPIDFATQDLQQVLRKAGYHQDRRAFIVWEGVTFYLPREAVEATLRVVGQSASGTSIVFDYVLESAIRGDHQDEALKRTMSTNAKWGEPWIFGMQEGKVAELAASCGLKVVSDLGADELTRLYLTKSDGTVAGHPGWYLRLCQAAVSKKR